MMVVSSSIHHSLFRTFFSFYFSVLEWASMLYIISVTGVLKSSAGRRVHGLNSFQNVMITFNVRVSVNFAFSALDLGREHNLISL